MTMTGTVNGAVNGTMGGTMGGPMVGAVGGMAPAPACEILDIADEAMPNPMFPLPDDISLDFAAITASLGEDLIEVCSLACLSSPAPHTSAYFCLV
ncbi:unnamed protein product [Closterium sp. NIES-53]